MMKMNSDERKNAAELDLSIAQITTGAHGDDEQLRAFHRAIQTGVDLPCDAFVIGEPVSMLAFDYDGNQRRGLVARCRREEAPSTWSRQPRSSLRHNPVVSIC